MNRLKILCYLNLFITPPLFAEPSACREGEISPDLFHSEMCSISSSHLPCPRLEPVPNSECSEKLDDGIDEMAEDIDEGAGDS